MLDKNIIAKNYSEDIEIDGVNVYDPSVSQFHLYKLVNADDSVYDHLGYTKQQMSDRLLIFPFQCGIRFFGEYQLLNIRDCLGSVTIEDIIKANKGELE